MRWQVKWNEVVLAMFIVIIAIFVLIKNGQWSKNRDETQPCEVFKYTILEKIPGRCLEYFIKNTSDLLEDKHEG